MSAMIQTLEKLFLKDNWDVQIQTGEFKGESISVLHYKVKEKVPMVFKQPNLIYSVTLQNELNDKCSQDYLSAEWNFMEMLNFRRSKKTIVSYDTDSPFFNQMLNLWSICYRIIPQDLRGLVIVVLEPGSQLQWITW